MGAPCTACCPGQRRESGNVGGQWDGVGLGEIWQLVEDEERKGVWTHRLWPDGLAPWAPGTLTCRLQPGRKMGVEDCLFLSYQSAAWRGWPRVLHQPPALPHRGWNGQGGSAWGGQGSGEGLSSASAIQSDLPRVT